MARGNSALLKSELLREPLKRGRGKIERQFPGSGRPLEELKRVSRILELIHILTVSPRRYRRCDLAARFGVSERTIQKDLDIIRHGLKLPLVRSLQGYYFEKTPLLPVLQFTFSEALALLLAVQAARHVSGAGSPELAAALNRLAALFPPEFGTLLRQAASLPAVTAQREHRQRMLLLLNQALIQGRKVRILYTTHSRGGAQTERVVRPYHLLPHVRSWHLIAYCEWREAVLVFKVDRIRKAVLLEECYRIPGDFDVAAYLGPVWGVMRGAASDPVDVVLRFTPEAGRRVAEESWHPSQQVAEQPDGSVLFRLHIAITPDFINWLLYYGSRVEVLAPPELREELAAEHRRAAEVNGAPGAAPGPGGRSE
ncbi:putative DNA-binding transcriptional regulator YafY [Thermodesulfitimonas autotrophica]|uniref:Putative DNA-binding transcriptional regulator YafY n=1 Tax=Thermodesulfitimonas autotrophica TaxID=1894989 RepID=A0A3N5ASQ2_9THEO|nr:putative DNA-binding transcriptional regulator YafY [Thermodesulfitimonas autotrophica]